MTRNSNIGKALGRDRLLPIAVLLILPGCGPQVAQEELGKIVYKVPKVAGSDEPYPLPPLADDKAPVGAAAESPPTPKPAEAEAAPPKP